MSNKKCTSKEWDTCRVEKMGCKGCYYNEKYINEIIEIIKDLSDEMNESAKYNTFDFKIASNSKEMIGKNLKSIIAFIEKQQKEIETLNVSLELAIKQDNDNNKIIKDSIKQIAKQEKMIDLMAGELFLYDYKNFNTPNEIVEYFEKAVKQHFEKEGEE